MNLSNEIDAELTKNVEIKTFGEGTVLYRGDKRTDIMERGFVAKGFVKSQGDQRQQNDCTIGAVIDHCRTSTVPGIFISTTTDPEIAEGFAKKDEKDKEGNVYKIDGRGLEGIDMRSLSGYFRTWIDRINQELNGISKDAMYERNALKGHKEDFETALKYSAAQKEVLILNEIPKDRIKKCIKQPDGSWVEQQ